MCINSHIANIWNLERDDNCRHQMRRRPMLARGTLIADTIGKTKPACGVSASNKRSTLVGAVYRALPAREVNVFMNILLRNHNRHAQWNTTD
jgi:hypothetical protein